jgi:hypothetical protein
MSDYRRHGMTDTKEYKTWGRIVQKCYNPNHISYPKYGARGVTFDYKDSFIDFFTEVGPCPSQGRDWSIDRINPNLGYVKGNMLWLESKYQLQNKRKSKRNTTGVTGVYLSGKRFSAEWWCNGVRNREIFDTFEEAVNRRESAIAEMNASGATRYTEYHGK